MYTLHCSSRSIPIPRLLTRHRIPKGDRQYDGTLVEVRGASLPAAKTVYSYLKVQQMVGFRESKDRRCTSRRPSVEMLISDHYRYGATHLLSGASPATEFHVLARNVSSVNSTVPSPESIRGDGICRCDAPLNLLQDVPMSHAVLQMTVPRASMLLLAAVTRRRRQCAKTNR